MSQWVKNPSAMQETQTWEFNLQVGKRSSGGGPGNPLQYSCLEKLMDRGAWWATIYSVEKSQTQTERLSMPTPPSLKTGWASESFSTECNLHMVASSKERGLKNV